MRTEYCCLFKSSLIFLIINSLSDACFSHSVCCLFTLLIVTFNTQTFDFGTDQCMYLKFVPYDFNVYLRNHEVQHCGDFPLIFLLIV